MEALTERERRVIELQEAGKSIREIAKEVHMSFRDIGEVNRKLRGETQVSNAATQVDNTPTKSKASSAYRLFDQRKTLVQVAIELDAGAEEVERWYMEYLRLARFDQLHILVTKLKGELRPFLALYFLMKNNSMTPSKFVSAMENVRELRSTEDVVARAKEKLFSLQDQIRQQEVKIRQQTNDLQEIYKQQEAATKELGEMKEQLKSLQNQHDSLKEQNAQLTHLNDEFYKGQIQPKIKAVVEETARSFVTSRKGIWIHALCYSFRAVKSDPSFRQTMEIVDRLVDGEPRTLEASANTTDRLISKVTGAYYEQLRRKIEDISTTAFLRSVSGSGTS